MGNLWQCLEQLPGQVAVPAAWLASAGDDFNFLRANFLRANGVIAASFPCLSECGCAHRVAPRPDGSFTAVCDCDSWNCEDIPLTRDDVTLMELNWPKLGRALTKALGCDARDADLGLPATKQIASFAHVALPVVLTIQHDRDEFLNIVGQLIGKLRERFVVLAPTSRWLDGNAKTLLANAQAGFFDLQSHVKVASNGFHAPKTAGDLFSPFLAETHEAATDDEARRLFALLKQLDSETQVRKAPVSQVFRLYCLEGLSRAAVAKRCGCAESLVTLRLQAIEKALKRPPAELRQLSSQFERMDDSLSDSRARHIHRKSAIDDGQFDED
jgi:hypothetical protein